MPLAMHRYSNLLSSLRPLVLGLVHLMLSACYQEPRELDFYRGLYAIEEGRWDWARLYFDADLARNPDRAESRRLLGIAWISGLGGGLGKGAEILEAYLKDHPDDVNTRRRLVSTLHSMGDTPAALKWAEELDASWRSLDLQGRVLADSDPELALSFLEAAMEAEPQAASAYTTAARICERLGRFEEARLYAKKAVDLNPLDPKSIARLARLERIRGDSAAAEHLIQALDHANHLLQSRDAHQLPVTEELRLLKALESLLGHRDYLLAVRLMGALFESGRGEEAVEVIQEIRYHPFFSVDDHLKTAKALSLSGRHREALEHLEEALARDPGNTVAMANLAVVRVELGQVDEARLLLEHALDERPLVARFHAVLASLELHEGHTEEAASHYVSALRIAPWEARWRQSLAAIYRADGDPESASRVLAELSEIESATDDDVEYGGPAFARPHDESLSDLGPDQGQDPAVATDQEHSFHFHDVSLDVGLDFAQYDGRSGSRFYMETTGSGGGFLDFDNDGDLDVYLLTGAPTPGSAPPASTPRNRLYENREGFYVDVSETAGVDDAGFGMGFCVGDVDGDGWLDFLVANYGPDRLFKNRGNGTFDEVGEAAGLADARWSSNCAFGDLDGDQDLDLYVTHYLDSSFENNPFCGDRVRNISAYCRPSAFHGVTDSLFINQGDGTFRDEAESRGIAAGSLEKGFGVILTDLDKDLDLDIFVANDSTANRLYVNDGKGSFSDQALITGLALSFDGLATSGMGVDIGDVDGDTHQDVILMNYAMESNALYRNDGSMMFQDVSQSTGVTSSSKVQVGWGVRLLDLDNDGDLDMSWANGHVVDNIAIFEPGVSYPQENLLLANNGSGSFYPVTRGLDETWTTPRVSRALAGGDWNNDGRLDLLIANCNDRFQLFENRGQDQGHWIGLVLEGPSWNRHAIGTQAMLVAGDSIQLREVRSGGSFQAQSDLRLHFGLGPHSGPVRVEIHWPDGAFQEEQTGHLDRYWPIRYDP